MTKHLHGKITNKKTLTTYEYSAFQSAADQITIVLRNIVFRPEYSVMYDIPVKHNSGRYWFKINKKSVTTCNAGPACDAAALIDFFEHFGVYLSETIEALIFSGAVKGW